MNNPASLLIHGILCIGLYILSIAANAQIPPDWRPEHYEGMSGLYYNPDVPGTLIDLAINERPGEDTLLWITFDQHGNQVSLTAVRTEEFFGFRFPVDAPFERYLHFGQVYWVRGGKPIGTDFDADAFEIVDIGFLQVDFVTCNEIGLSWHQDVFAEDIPVVPDVYVESIGRPIPFIVPNLERLTRIKNSRCPEW